jgi:hypothetical protein
MHSAEFYTGIIPEVYAALRGTHFRTDRYRTFIEDEGSPALELGCGDDGPFFDLANEGFDVEGVHSSADMRIAAAKQTRANPRKLARQRCLVDELDETPRNPRVAT